MPNFTGIMHEIQFPTKPPHTDWRSWQCSPEPLAEFWRNERDRNGKVRDKDRGRNGDWRERKPKTGRRQKDRKKRAREWDITEACSSGPRVWQSIFVKYIYYKELQELQRAIKRAIKSYKLTTYTQCSFLDNKSDVQYCCRLVNNLYFMSEWCGVFVYAFDERHIIYLSSRNN